MCLAARTTEKLEQVCTLVHVQPNDVTCNKYVMYLPAQVADSCRKHGAKEVEIYSVDLSNSKDIDQLCKDLLSKHKVDVLVNNAGMATFNEAPYEGELKNVELLQLPAAPTNQPLSISH